MTADADRPGHGEQPPELGWSDEISVGRTSVATGTRWSLVSLVVKQATRIGFSVVLARLLGPESFGIIGQATIYLAFTTVFLDVGIASALIQHRTLDRALVGAATTVNFVVLSALIVLTLLGADLWGTLFDTPELGGVLRILSITFLFNGLSVVPAALLTRRLEFRRLGIAEVLSSIVGGCAGVGAALAGAGYWALVIQTLSRDAVYAVMLIGAAGRPIISWSREAFSRIASFSRNVFGAQMLSFVGQNADNFLVAWRLGAVPLANYALSYRLLMLPLQVVGQTANRLVFPVFSRLGEDPARQARYFSSVLSGISISVLLPLTIVALAAPTAIPIVFGPDWSGAIVAMQILAMSAVLRTLSSVSSAVLFANGRASWVFRLNLVSIPVHLLGFAVGLRWGIEGVAWSFLIVAAPLTWIWLSLTRRLIPLGAGDQLRALAPALTGALAAALCWWGLASLDAAGFAWLIIGSLLASAVGLGAIMLLWRGPMRELVAFAQLVGSREKADGDPA